MRKNLTKFLLLTIAFTFALSVNYIFAAWIGPTQTPPLGNTPMPVNVGSIAQVKDGGLSLNSLAVFGNGYFQDNVGIGTVSPSAKLDVAGGVKVGNDSAACTATKEGTIRYNDTTSCMEYCGGANLGWLTIGACGLYSKTVTGNDHIGAGNSETLMQDMQISDNFPNPTIVDFVAKVYIVACGGCTNQGVIRLYVDGVQKKEQYVSVDCSSGGNPHCTQWHDVSLDDTISSGGEHTVEIRWNRTGGSEPNPQLWQPGHDYPRVLKINQI